jgi:uncharacterized protein YjaG (DUF416 family)
MSEPMRAFNREDISDVLAGLTKVQLAAFIASCAGRLIDFFEAFSREECVGDPAVIQSGLHALWEFSKKETKPDADLLKAVESQSPENGNVYTSIFTPMAQFACDSVVFGLEFIDGQNETAAVDVSIGIQTAVEMYLATVNQVYVAPADCTSAARTIQTDYCNLPLFASELSKQMYDISVVRAATTITEATISQLKGCGSLGVRPVERFCIR